jgi:hypothetical protein
VKNVEDALRGIEHAAAADLEELIQRERRRRVLAFALGWAVGSTAMWRARQW